MSSKKKNDPLSDLNIKLKTCDPEVQHFVAALKKENLKLHQKIGRLQADIVSHNSKNKVSKQKPNHNNNSPIKLSVSEIRKIQKQIEKDIKEELGLNTKKGK